MESNFCQLAVGSLDEISNEPEPVASVLSSDSASEAEIQFGKGLVIAGFIIAVGGIIVYCTDSFSMGVQQQELSDLGKVGLLLIGAGVLSWFVGAIKYFHGAIEACRPEDLF